MNKKTRKTKKKTSNNMKTLRVVKEDEDELVKSFYCVQPSLCIIKPGIKQHILFRICQVILLNKSKEYHWHRFTGKKGFILCKYEVKLVHKSNLLFGSFDHSI